MNDLANFLPISLDIVIVSRSPIVPLLTLYLPHTEYTVINSTTNNRQEAAIILQV